MRRFLPSLAISFALAILLGTGLWLLFRRAQRPSEVPPGSGPPTASSETGGDRSRRPAEVPGGAAGPPGAQASAPAEEAPAERAELPISIEGRVSDPSGAPVAGARVAAFARADLAAAIARQAKLLEREPLEALRALRASLEDLARRLPSASSGSDGWYALRGLPEGEHRVIVLHEDYLPHGEENWILVELGKKTRYDVELRGGERISGRVRERSGRPVAGAIVRASSSERGRLRGVGKLIQAFLEEWEGALLFEPPPSKTDALGAFRTGPLAPGIYDIRVAKEGYSWAELRGVRSDSEGIVVELEPAIRVSGRVLSPRGSPIAGAEILLAEPAPDLQGPETPLALACVDVDVFSEKARRGATDAEGRFELLAFAPGSYELSVRAPGYPEFRERVELESAALDLGDIVLAEGSEIAGTVLSSEGLPVADADVWVPRPARPGEDSESRRISVLEAGPGSSIARAKTDARGAFRLAGLSPGAHELAVFADGYTGRLLEGVVPGGPGLTIPLERGLAVRGLVVDAESGEPLAGARVDVPWDPAPAQTTDERGRFELRGLRRDPSRKGGAIITVRVALEGYREAQATAASPDPLSVPLDAGEIRLRKLGPGDSGPVISGVVRDRQGRPIAGARVWAEVPGWPTAFLRVGFFSRAAEARTAGDGSFSMDAPQAPGRFFEVLAAHPGFATSRVGPFERDSSEGFPFLEIELGEGAILEGRVTAPEGTPLPGARIRLRRDIPASEEVTPLTRILPEPSGPTAYAGRDGSYRLARIEPGNYFVEAQAPGYAARTLGPIAIGAGGREGSAEIPPTRLDISLEPGAALEGRVIDSAGRPLAGAEVVAFPLAESSEAAPFGPPPGPGEEDDLVETGALGVAAATTGADGRYAIEHLPRGEFRLLARARGYEPAWILSAVPGETLPDLILAPLGRISLRVRDATSGAPIASFEVRFERKDAEGNFREQHAKARSVEDPGGRFFAGGFRAGTWRVRVISGGSLPWAAEGELEPGGELQLEALLRPGCRIAGTVSTPEGSPIERASVNARREGERRDSASAETGPDGTFILSGLEEGAYELWASHPDHYAEASEGKARAEVSYEKDAAVRFVLRPAGAVAGRIRGLEPGSSGADAFVVLFAAVGREESFEVRVDELGFFERSGIRPGRYRLRVFGKRWGPLGHVETFPVAPGDDSWEIEVRARELTTFEADAR